MTIRHNRYHFPVKVLLLVVYGMSVLHPVLPILSFKVHQKEIAATLCENRERPQLDCQGQCQLTRKLAEAQNAPQDPAEREPATRLVWAAPHLTPYSPIILPPAQARYTAVPAYSDLLSPDFPPPVPPPKPHFA